MKKLLAIFLSFLMMLGFAACGGDKEEAFDPNLGIYEAYTASLSGFEMRVTDLYAGGFTIELKEKGKCVITVDSDTANGKWSLQGSIINVSGGGIELTGTLKEGEMVFEKLMGTDVTMKFRNTAFTPLKEETAEKQGEPVRQNESPVENQPIATQAGTYYYLHHYEVSGQTVTNDIIKANGMDVYYVRMNSDGTGEFCPLSENALPMTYTDSVLRVENYLAMEYTLEGDTLTVDMVGTKLTFVKGNAPAASIPEAPVVNDPPVVVENPAQAPVLTQAPASTQAPVVTQAPSAALHPGEPSSSGDGTVADLESIYRLYAWFERMPSQYRKSYCTYDTIVSFTGVEGLDDGNSGPNSITDLGYHNFKWGFDEKRFIHTNFWCNNEGVWTVRNWNASNGTYFEDVDIDAYDFSYEPPLPAGADPKATVQLSYTAEQNRASHTVTFTTPAYNWYLDNGAFGGTLYNWPEKGESDIPQIKINYKRDMEHVNFYFDNFQNVVELPDRVVGGITMKVRSYFYMNYQHTEIYGELPTGAWVSIDIIGLNISSGTTAGKIVDSMIFS